MELEHHFEVPVGIDRAWTHLLDMEQVAACFPGATLASADGEEYTGSVKVKLGPIQLTYKGSARITEADESAHRAVIEASGKAARSGSTASMTVTATAVEKGADRTEVTMATDLTVTGRPAQFGRGVMADVGDKILGRFADCVAGKLSAGGDAAGGAESGGAESGGAAEESGTAAGKAGESGGADASGDKSGPASGSDSESADGNSDGDKAASGEKPAHEAAPDGGDAAPDAKTESGPAPASARTATEPAGPSYLRNPDPVDTSEPIDLLESAGAPVLKRLVPVLAGVTGILLLRWLFKRRAGRRSRR